MASLVTMNIKTMCLAVTIAASTPALSRGAQASVVPALVGPEGNVTGTMTLRGTRLALHHVYASAQPAGGDKTGVDVKVLLSDVPLDQEARTDVLARLRLAREGRAHLIEVTVAPSGVLVAATLYGREFAGMTAVTGGHQFTRDRLDDKVIAGRFYSERRRLIQGVSTEYDATFLAAIFRPRTEADRALAVASPAGLAAETHLAAIRSGAMAVLMTTLTADAAGELSGATGTARAAEWRAALAADARVVDVLPQTDGSMIAVVEGHERGGIVSQEWRLVMERGSWRVRR